MSRRVAPLLRIVPTAQKSVPCPNRDGKVEILQYGRMGVLPTSGRTRSNISSTSCPIRLVKGAFDGLIDDMCDLIVV